MYFQLKRWDKPSNTEAALNNLFRLIHSLMKTATELLSSLGYYLIYPQSNYNKNLG